MRATGLLFIVLLCCSCNAGADVLTDSDWTNGQQSCASNHLSFRESKIAYYPKGAEPLVAFEIDSVLTDAANPNISVVTARPGNMWRKAWANAGLQTPGDLRFIFRFAVSGDRLELVNFQTSPSMTNEFSQENIARLFDLVRCPS